MYNDEFSFGVCLCELIKVTEKMIDGEVYRGEEEVWVEILWDLSVKIIAVHFITFYFAIQKYIQIEMMLKLNNCAYVLSNLDYSIKINKQLAPNYLIRDLIIWLWEHNIYSFLIPDCRFYVAIKCLVLFIISSHVSFHSIPWQRIIFYHTPVVFHDCIILSLEGRMPHF